MSNKLKIALGIIMVLIIITIPMLGNNDEFSGTDDQAVETITSIDKNYEPWVDSVFEINDDMENMFFMLQAVMGSFVLGICLGRISNKPKVE